MVPRKIFNVFLEEVSYIMGDASGTVLYMVGKKIGKILSSEIKRKDSRLLLFLSLLEEQNYGVFKIKKQGKEYVITMKKAPRLPGKKIGTHHFVRGILTGFLELETKQSMYGIETKCRSKGDSYCEFIIKREVSL